MKRRSSDTPFGNWRGIKPAKEPRSPFHSVRRSGHRSWLRRGIYALLALVGGFVLGLAILGYRPVLAGVCPACFGFQQVGPNVYTDSDDAAQIEALLARVRIAQDRVRNGLGPDFPIESPPRLLACHSEFCAKLMGGHKTRGLAFGAHLIYLTPRGLEAAIMAHEFAHVALHHEIGLTHLNGFPAWVDEGMATYLSQDARFDLSARCEAGANDLPVSAKEWRRSEGARDGSYYARSGCYVAQWLAAHPDKSLLDLIALHHPDQP